MTAREGLVIPLRLAGVTKSYRTHFWQRPAVSLAGLDLDLRAGEILGLLGRNMLKVIAARKPAAAWCAGGLSWHGRRRPPG